MTSLSSEAPAQARALETLRHLARMRHRMMRALKNKYDAEDRAAASESDRTLAHSLLTCREYDEAAVDYWDAVLQCANVGDELL